MASQRQGTAPKQDRKEYHFKLFKNPPEFAVAMALAATKKASMSWERVVISALMTGSTCLTYFLLMLFSLH
jgi:hypothetical protein